MTKCDYCGRPVDAGSGFVSESSYFARQQHAIDHCMPNVGGADFWIVKRYLCFKVLRERGCE
jgi:hypothetical protein